MVKPAVFTCLWSATILLELFGRIGLVGTISGQCCLAACLLMLCFPAQAKVFLFLSLATLIHFVQNVSAEPNNVSLENFIHINALIIGAFLLVKNKGNLSPEVFFEWLFAFLKPAIIVFYFFAFWAKLNTDFLNPSVSCSSLIVDRIREFYQFDFLNWTSSLQAKQLIIWVILVIEAAIPILLMFNRTLPWAYLLGSGLHIAIALDYTGRISTFSWLMVVLYVVFLSQGAWQKIEHWGKNFQQLWGQKRPNQIKLRILFAILIYILFLYHQHYQFSSLSIFVIKMVMLIGISIMLQIVVWSTKNIQNEKPTPLLIKILLIPLITLGLMPYLGLRNSGNMTMYANLRFFSGHNHLVMPAGLRVFNQDMVLVLDSNNKDFRKIASARYLIPAFEFRRLMQRIEGDFYVRCIFKGEDTLLYKHNFGRSEHPLLKPLSWWSYRFIRFKPEDILKDNRCYYVGYLL